MLPLVEPSIKKSKVTGKGLPSEHLTLLRQWKEAWLPSYLEKESQVNSVHRQSIKELASNFRVTAIDPRDQTIEAIESIDEHRIIGLQWHPEFLVNGEDGNLNYLSIY